MFLTSYERGRGVLSTWYHFPFTINYTESQKIPKTRNKKENWTKFQLMSIKLSAKYFRLFSILVANDRIYHFNLPIFAWCSRVWGFVDGTVARWSDRAKILPIHSFLLKVVWTSTLMSLIFWTKQDNGRLPVAVWWTRRRSKNNSSWMVFKEQKARTNHMLSNGTVDGGFRVWVYRWIQYIRYIWYFGASSLERNSNNFNWVQ